MFHSIVTRTARNLLINATVALAVSVSIMGITVNTPRDLANRPDVVRSIASDYHQCWTNDGHVHPTAHAAIMRRPSGAVHVTNVQVAFRHLNQVVLFCDHPAK